MAEPARKAQSMQRVGLEIAPRRPQSNIADSARPDLPCKTAENWFQKRGSSRWHNREPYSACVAEVQDTKGSKLPFATNDDWPGFNGGSEEQELELLVNALSQAQCAKKGFPRVLDRCSFLLESRLSA